MLLSLSATDFFTHFTHDTECRSTATVGIAKPIGVDVHQQWDFDVSVPNAAGSKAQLDRSAVSQESTGIDSIKNLFPPQPTLFAPVPLRLPPSDIIIGPIRFLLGPHRLQHSAQLNLIVSSTGEK